jgi:hypothetical protein
VQIHIETRVQENASVLCKEVKFCVFYIKFHTSFEFTVYPEETFLVFKGDSCDYLLLIFCLYFDFHHYVSFHYSGQNVDSNNTYGGGGGSGGGGGGGQTEEVVENEQPPKVVLSTTTAVLPRLRDFHNLLLDPPHVSSADLNSRSDTVSVNSVNRV